MAGRMRLLKKIRQRYTIRFKYLEHTGIFISMSAIDHKEKCLYKFSSIEQFVDHVAYKWFGFFTESNRRLKRAKRKSRVNYYREIEELRKENQ